MAEGAYAIYDAKGQLVGNVMLDTAKHIHGNDIASIDHQKKEIKLKASSPYSNGRSRAEQAIANKMSKVGIANATRSMSKTEIVKRAREGRWELLQDIDGKRNGQHIEVRLPSGKTQHIQIEGE